MRIAFLICVASCLTLGACATVDVTQLAGSDANSSVDTQLSQNTVIRSAKNLYKHITSSGWATPNQTSLQKTATVLLKGEGAVKQVEASTYRGNSLSDLQGDMVNLIHHTEQTTKTAEVFLSVSPDAADLKAELSFLEVALISCRKSETNFQLAMNELGAQNVSELTSLNGSINALRDITNQYGERVRAQYTHTASNGS